MKLEAFTFTTSVVIRHKLEKEIEDLEARIKSAGSECDRIQITREDIKAFMAEAKRIVEHPVKILLNQADLRVQRDLFGLMFEKIPTYEEIVSGTPKLSTVFEPSSGFVADKSQLVTHLIQDWNQVYKLIKDFSSI